MDMIEKVAKALCDGNWDAASFNETANGEEPEEQREYWREKARTAIEALREPTEAMKAAWDKDYGAWHNHEIDADFHLYTAMIDAALSPPTS